MIKLGYVDKDLNYITFKEYIEEKKLLEEFEKYLN